MKKYIMQVLVKEDIVCNRGRKHTEEKWANVQTSDHRVYQFDTKHEAINMLNMCYGDNINLYGYGNTARVKEVEI